LRNTPLLTNTPNQNRSCLPSVLNTGTLNTDFTARCYGFCDENSKYFTLFTRLFYSQCPEVVSPMTVQF